MSNKKYKSTDLQFVILANLPDSRYPIDQDELFRRVKASPILDFQISHNVLVEELQKLATNLHLINLERTSAGYLASLTKETSRNIIEVLSNFSELTLKTENNVSEKSRLKMSKKGWDLFICHASEDKDTFVRELASALAEKGLKVWYDEFTLTLGDSLRRKIDQGLANSRYGLVVLSEAFFSKDWPKKELDGLVAKETDLDKIILPIWHGVTRKRVLSFSPILADRLAVSSNKGVAYVVEEIIKAMRAVGYYDTNITIEKREINENEDLLFEKVYGKLYPLLKRARMRHISDDEES